MQKRKFQYGRLHILGIEIEDLCLTYSEDASKKKLIDYL